MLAMQTPNHQAPGAREARPELRLLPSLEKMAAGDGGSAGKGV